MKIQRFIAIGMSSWLLASVPSLIAADEILFEENFNDDGEGTRYTSEGRFVAEAADHGLADQAGPIYWGLNSEVSVVGVPGPTVARRAVVAWHHELTAESVTEDGLEMMDATIAWLTEDKANLRVLFSPPPAGDGDSLLVDRLVAKGATITDDDVAAAIPAVGSFDLVIHSSSGSNPSRFTNFAVPYFTYNGQDHDDDLVTTIGASESRNFGDITVADPDHPAAAGKTGELSFFTGEVLLDFPGTGVPDGSTTVATYPIVDVPPVTSLADIDLMIAGEVETVVDDGTIPVADMDSGNQGNFSGNGGDNEVPGNPIGSFATVATGTFNVKEAGTFGMALWVAGGARLRIDLDGNGIDDGDTVITQDTPEFLDDVIDGTSNYADVAFPTVGEYAFEWVAYSPTVDFGSEIFFTFVSGADQREPLDDQNVWAPLADWEASGIDSLPLNLNGEIAVTKYEQPSQVIENRPLIVAINGPSEGGQVFGGGAFIDFEGTGFFAGAALNKFEGAVKSVTFNPVDVTGETGLKLRMLVAATTLDFETSDFLDVRIDPNNSGTFQELIHFTAPSEGDKFFSDGTTDLNIALQEITYDIPDGATNLVIQIEALTTWWNEIVAFDYIRVVKEVPDVVDPTLPPLDLLVLGADDTGETGADANVLAFLRESFGADNIRYANSDSTDGSETADLIIMSSTFGSGSVRGKFHNAAVPVMNWEEAVMDASVDGEFGQSAVVMTKSTDTTQMVLGDHPIAGDLAGTTIDFLTEAGGETLGSAELSAGTVSVGDGAGGAADGLSMIFVTDTGGEVAAGAGVTDNVSPARRVAFPITDVTFDSLTDAGKQLFLNSILWAAGEIGGDPRADAVAVSSGALTEATVVNFGTLLGDASYEFSFFAVKDGVSTAIAGSEVWGLKLDQWNEQGVFGLTEFGVADHIFTALDGKSVASVFDREVHVVIVNDAAAGESRLFVDGEQVGTWAGNFVLGGDVNVMAARIEAPVDLFGAGSTLNGWASYNSALTAEDIAALATSPFPVGETPVLELTDLTDVQRSAGAFGFALPEGVTADIEYSTDLTAWEVIASGVTGVYEDADAGRAGASSGYYRGIRN